MKHILILICSFLLSLSINADVLNSDVAYFNHFSAKGELPQINILSIYQDELGAMWFGTSEGICRYNGIETQIFSSTGTNKGLTQNIIYAICGNRDGSIYIRANYDLVLYDLKQQRFECLKLDNVRAIFYQDGILWFASENTIYQYIESSKKITEFISFDSNEFITSLYVSAQGKIWMGTKKGLKLIDSNTKETITYILKDAEISTIFVDSRNNYWIGTTKKGVFLLNDKAQQEVSYEYIEGVPSLSNNQVRTILEDNLGKIWIGTFMGLNCFDPKTKHWTTYTQSDNRSNLSHSSIFSLCKDKQGTIWVGTYFGSVNYYNPEVDIFKFYNADASAANHLSFPFVGKMLRDKHNNLWICTEGGGLNCLDLNTLQISSYLQDSNTKKLSKTRNLKCIWYDHQKDLLYIGIHNGGLCIFDIKTKKSRFLTHNSNDKFSLPNDAIRDMKFYDGMLYILSAQGICKMDMETEKFYPPCEDTVLNEVINNNHVYSFYIDTQDRMWIYNSKLISIDLKSHQINTYVHDPNDEHSIGKFMITNIFETQNKNMMFATEGSGLFLFRPESNDFIKIRANENKEKKEIGDFCYYLSETNTGNLIVLSNKGVTVLDETYEILYQSSKQFPISRFFQGSGVYVTDQDKIFIGGTNGLVSVFESELIDIKDKDYNLYFDKLYINDKLILPLDESNILNETLPLSKSITLKYDQNNVTIEFATSDYLQNVDRTYEYMLEGLDPSWTVASSNIITYKGIHPGNYKLLLRERLLEEDSHDHIKTLYITIAPPFYKTIYAYLIYGLIIILILILIFRFLIWRSNLEASVEFERREKERNENLTQTKLRFFTNISHELRTPLTLIIGQIEMASKSKSISEVQNRISKAYLNAEHMRRLITELLDFRKQEQGFYKLKIEEVELVGYLKNIYDSFKEHAIKENIKYEFDNQTQDEIYAYIDVFQFQKVINNLLSNAFKYTAPGGKISLVVSTDDEKIIIKIIDNGIGIAQKDLDDIFERFYQVEYRASNFSLGTGIGLALAKEIVSSHMGTITVESKLDQGSIFTISLFKGKEHFPDYLLSEGQNQEIVSTPNKTHLPIDIESDMNEDNSLETEDEKRYNLLIVEDNIEVLNFLVEAFSKLYNVHTAKNGKEGLEKTLELHPDLVLSDVMMPEMSGKEMCFKIKSNLNISHIPVVLLTAQDSQEQTIEGYMFGADDYVTKPFNIEILISRCNSIVKNRRLLYKKLTEQKDSIVTFNINEEKENQFLEKAVDIIKDNFDNPEFDMNMLASELNLGRNKLYTKIKDLTSLTPNEFTLNIKLKESLRLLDDHLYLNISDIAIKLGFSSPKYFSKCFKTFYGISPLQWRKDKHAEDNKLSSDEEEIY